MVVLHRPFRAQKAYVLFAGVCPYLCFVVEVAVVVAVVAVLFYDVLLGQWQAITQFSVWPLFCRQPDYEFPFNERSI